MGIMIFFVWIFCAIVSAVIAKNKGRSAFGWFILGALFGPFGFIVAALPPIKNGDQVADAGNLRKCPFCAEMIKPDAIKCRFCGTDVPKDLPSEPMYFKMCPECSKSIRQDAQWCPYCGRGPLGS